MVFYKYIALMLLLILFCATNSVAQNKQYAIWYFSRNGLDFNSNPPAVISNPTNSITMNNSVLCNPDGTLKYRYSNGIIYNSNNNIILNGNLPYGLSTSQKDLFINNGNFTYFFHLDSSYIVYAIIDNLADNGKGSVVDLKNLIPSVYPDIISGFNIIQSDNCEKYWIIVRTRHKRRIYTLNLQNEINFSHETPTILDYDWRNMYQFEHYSKQGNIYILAHENTIETGVFDKTTGTFSNQSIFTGNFTVPITGYEFSHDNSFLYFKHSTQLYQVPLVDNIPIWANLIQIGNFNSVNAYGAKIGLDNKIYFIKNAGNLVSTINNPNLSGTACNFQENNFSLLFNQIGTNFPITPILTYNCNQPNIMFTNICLGSVTQFQLTDTENIQSVLWNFGDSQTSTEHNPTHIYASAGTYTVTLDVTFTDNTTQTVTKDIEIFDKPLKPTIEHE